jgi:hypothetical protein
VRDSGRAVVGVVGIALAVTAGGCRQLFGIDDTDVLADAGAPDAPADGALSPQCTQDHVLCMDFDTTESGIDQLPLEMITGGASIGEDNDVGAPSLPRLLRATTAAGVAAESALRVQQYAPGVLTTTHVTMWMWVSSPENMETCAPGVLAIVWGDQQMNVYRVALLVDAGLQLVVDASGISQTDTIPLPRDAWVSIELNIDPAQEEVKLDSVFGGASLTAPGFSIVPALPSLIGLGISVADDHGDCTIAVDNVVLDSGN